MNGARILSHAAAVAGGWVPITIGSGETLTLRFEALAGPVGSSAFYSATIALGWAVSLASLPLCGWVSDRSVAHGGGRRRWLAIGAVAMLIAGLLLAIAPTTGVLAAVWIAAQVPTAMVVTVALARIADDTIPQTRGRASAMAGAAPAIALLIGAAVVFATRSSGGWMFFASAVAGAVLVVPSLLVPGSAKSTSLMKSSAAAMMTSVFDAFRRPQLRWLIITISLAFSGLAVGRIYLVPIISDATGFSKDAVVTTATEALVAGTLMAIAGSLIAGAFARRSRPAVLLLGISAILAAVPLIALAIAGSAAAFIAAGALLGLIVGAINGATYGVYLHMPSTSTQHGEDLGLINAAETIPYIVVPLIGAVVQAFVGQSAITGLLIVGAVAAIGAGAFALIRGLTPRQHTASV